MWNEVMSVVTVDMKRQTALQTLSDIRILFGNPLEDAGLVIFGLLNERYAQCFDVHKLFFCGISNPVDDNAFF
uniref:Uncharacterized protein n=1 Tax=Cucumis sativus TaxID=3659 RepID=A0A0A0LVI3_CUCSA